MADQLRRFIVEYVKNGFRAGRVIWQVAYLITSLAGVVAACLALSFLLGAIFHRRAADCGVLTAIYLIAIAGFYYRSNEDKPGVQAEVAAVVIPRRKQDVFDPPVWMA